MPQQPQGDVTQLLIAYSDGDREVMEQLMLAVDVELRQIARRQLRGERADHTLQTTALINEAYLKLVDQQNTRWQTRAHFFAICSRLMRRILIDHARRKRASKRWGGIRRVTLNDPTDLPPQGDVDLIDLDQALNDLEAIEPRQAKLIEFRYFGGLTIEEAAEAAEVSPATAKRDLQAAKEWLQEALDQR